MALENFLKSSLRAGGLGGEACLMCAGEAGRPPRHHFPPHAALQSLHW